MILESTRRAHTSAKAAQSGSGSGSQWWSVSGSPPKSNQFFLDPFRTFSESFIKIHKKLFELCCWQTDRQKDKAALAEVCALRVLLFHVFRMSSLQVHVNLVVSIKVTVGIAWFHLIHPSSYGVTSVHGQYSVHRVTESDCTSRICNNDLTKLHSLEFRKW